MLRTRILLFSLATALGAMHVSAQSNTPLKPITVCDVFTSRLALNGKFVAVIARLGGGYHGSWLGDERCAKEVKLGRHSWPTEIWLEYDATGQTVFTSPMVIDWDDANSKIYRFEKNYQTAV
jgi:hypothetical protein